MRILFCNIAWMKYYKGFIPGTDTPLGGGSYVEQTGDTHEKNNFCVTDLTFPEDEEKNGVYCVGFVETKGTSKGKSNQLHIEKIDGCELLNTESIAEDVLVIYCAKYPYTDKTESVVVGWYKHATVFRDFQKIEFNEEGIENQFYNAIARVEDCVLLPTGTRRQSIWKAQRRKSGISYGFGQSNVWFASGAEDNPYLKSYLDNLVKNIETYSGENWLMKEPE